MTLRLLFALLLLAAPAEPRELWVRPTGSNLKQGAFDGSDSTLAHALSLAWFNANAVGADTCRISWGSYATPIMPRNGGTDAARIVYIGAPLTPEHVVVTSITLDSSDVSVGDYITVVGVTSANDISVRGGYHHARWDSIRSCISLGGLSLAGGYNTVWNSRIGDGTFGDAFSLTWDSSVMSTAPNSIPGQDGVWPNFANNKQNHIADCTFDLAKTGSGNPVIAWQTQDSLLIDRCRFKVRLGASASSLHLWTIYGMTNSIVRDCYFNGQTLSPTQTAHFPSTRDVFHHNSFVRDTIVEEPGPGVSINLNLMTSGATGITGEYNGTNTYDGMFVRVRGEIGYQERCYNDTHRNGIYITNGEESPNRFGYADSLTLVHNTIVSMRNALLGADGGSIVASHVTQNIFYAGFNHTTPIDVSPTQGNANVQYMTYTPGVSDSNLFYSSYGEDSVFCVNGPGGGNRFVAGDASNWCATYANDCYSHWLTPQFEDTLSWQTFDPTPIAGSVAYDTTLWADDYVGAIPAFADKIEPVVNLTGTDAVLPSVGTTDLTWTATDNVAVASVDLYYSKATTPTVWVLIANGLAAAGTYAWGYPAINETRLNVRARGFDAAGNVGTDVIVLRKECPSPPCDDEDPNPYEEPAER